MRCPTISPNPERWRYLPEARLKPGNMLERFLVSSFIAPFVFFEQDIGAGGGIALTDIDFEASAARSSWPRFLYTSEGSRTIA